MWIYQEISKLMFICFYPVSCLNNRDYRYLCVIPHPYPTGRRLEGDFFLQQQCRCGCYKAQQQSVENCFTKPMRADILNFRFLFINAGGGKEQHPGILTVSLQNYDTHLQPQLEIFWRLAENSDGTSPFLQTDYGLFYQDYLE